MTCVPIKTPGGVAIVCFRGRKHRTCQVPQQGQGKLCRAKAELLCDGCDVALCSSCSVQVEHSGAKRDLCPQCFAPVWRLWVLEHLVLSRSARRAAFRVFAREHHEAFASITLSKAGAA